MGNIEHVFLLINSAFSIKNLLCVAFMAVLMGCLVFYIYTTTHKNSNYKPIGITITAISPICAVVIYSLTINETLASILVISILVISVVLMFIKQDLKSEDQQIYLLWSISCGILCGNENFISAAVLCIVIFAIYIVIKTINDDMSRYILIEGNDSRILDIQALVFKYFNRKAKLIINENEDDVKFKMVYLVSNRKLNKLRNKRIDITELIGNIEGVKKVLIVGEDQINEQ